MGESSAPRRPTHDTNTSRRQVKTHTHININNNNTSSKQSKYSHTMKFTGLIASTLMLLLAVMASKASAVFTIEDKENCCRAYTAKCQACTFNMTVDEICLLHNQNPRIPLAYPMNPFEHEPLEGCPKVVDGIIINPKKP